MAKVFIEETTLTAIGDAIRGKTGKTELIDPANMSTEIAGIEAGGGGEELPESAFKLTGDCSYRFKGWEWFIDQYGDRISTEGITNISYMFDGLNTLEEIPFQLNITKCAAPSYLLNGCTNLKVCPKVRGTFSLSEDSPWGFQPYYTIQDCASLRDVEDLFLPEMFDTWSKVQVTSPYSSPYVIKLQYLCSLRKVPTWLYKFRLNEESTEYPYADYGLYYQLFPSCCSLDEVVDLPVWKCAGTATSNMFSNIVVGCGRLNRFTFETNEDGSPIETQWTNQHISLNYVGFDYEAWGNPALSKIPRYNSGITMDKVVRDDFSYSSLKNDPDWWAVDANYSRYNHDSAVETINSLPDTSAAGGNNTLVFGRNQGVKTDGGAIGNLTEEEIAVAAAKGWTISLT